MSDLLGLGDLIKGVAGVADPYFYTDQEQASDKLKAAQTTELANETAQKSAAVAATVQIANTQAAVKEKAIMAALVGVLAVGGVVLASSVLGKK